MNKRRYLRVGFLPKETQRVSVVSGISFPERL